jgi:hypothetical protein
MAEADTYKAIEAVFDSILELGHNDIMPVVNQG